ncbi:MAG: hypothetical protein EU518_01365 [Promethearchaeota archaeon]|nr:MAG: hypothetical protein EU518_01365 [Candidatus Lokiarchaeota archaeon]
MSNTLVIKVPEEVNRNDIENELKSKFHIPEELIVVIEIESKKDVKKVNKSLRKLIKKSKFNAKYLEETISVEKVRNTPYFQNFGIY